jgi:hypothetical protein
MDYLDPKKQFRNRIILMVGYVLVGVAIVIGTLVLLYQAYGFGLGKNGTVVQNGLFFLSSHPHPANIYANGALEPVKTNTRLSLPAGIYNIVMTRNGYRDWHRTLALDGGSVEHVDYPFLFPKTLTPKKVQSYASPPGLVSQSPDHRWMLVEQPGTLTNFDAYDLKNPAKAPVALSLPADLLTKASGAEGWQPGEWADDNQHLLLQHVYDGKTEFILIDRTDPGQSVNLSKTLSLNPTKLTLRDKKYDQYYTYDASTANLETVSLKATAPQPFLEHVLSYQSYGNNTMLYATDSNAPAGKVLVKLRTGSKTSVIRIFPAGSTYLLDLTEYSGSLYAAVSATSQDKLYIYKDPVGQLAANPRSALVPAQVLHVTSPNYLSFSDNAQFIVVENAAEFGVYDIENETAYHYTSSHALDAPQTHASWMDGDRLAYVSGSKLLVFDYDNANQQVLVAADSHYEPAFSPNYKFVYNLAPAATAGQLDLDQTSLLSTADQ